MFQLLLTHVTYDGISLRTQLLCCCNLFKTFLSALYHDSYFSLFMVWHSQVTCLCAVTSAISKGFTVEAVK